MLQPFLPFSRTPPAAAECAVDEDLLSILRLKLKSEQLTAGVDSLMTAAAVLRENRLTTASHFGNGGEVANLLSEAKLRKEKRRGDGSIESRQAVGRRTMVGGGHVRHHRSYQYFFCRARQIWVADGVTHLSKSPRSVSGNTICVAQYS